MKNDHGLSREIPPDIKREVRKRCGFGCVVCGSAIYEYEHYDPEFKDAIKHSADGIALLCPTDHRRKEKKLLSKENYLKAIANPKPFESNKAYTEWKESNFAPTIIMGNKIFKGGTSILKVDDELLLGFKPPEEKGAPPRLFARFFDNEQREVFSIIDNQIQIHSDAFDVETTAENWIVRSKLYKIDLNIQLLPPDKIIINQINFRYKKWGLKAKKNEFSLLFDEIENIQMLGPMEIEGPCLFNLSGEGKVDVKDMNMNWLAPTSHLASKPIMFKWPLFLYIKTEDDTPIHDIELAVLIGHNLLPLFTTEDNAKQKGSERIPTEYKLKSLGSTGLIMLLEKVALPKGITHAVLNPNLDATEHTLTPIDLKQFIADNKSKINDDDPCPCKSGKSYKECHGKL